MIITKMRTWIPHTTGLLPGETEIGSAWIIVWQNIPDEIEVDAVNGQYTFSILTKGI